MCKDIIENPEKIYDLKSNYPKYYVDEYIDTDMKDTINLKFLYHYIDTLFNRHIDTLYEEFSGRDNPYPKLVARYMNKSDYKELFYAFINKDIRDNIELYEINFWKNNKYGMHFILIKYINKYYIFYIGRLEEVRID